MDSELRTASLQSYLQPHKNYNQEELQKSESTDRRCIEAMTDLVVTQTQTVKLDNRQPAVQEITDQPQR